MDKKLEIDRFFNDVRENMEKNSFQNVRKDFIDIFDEFDVPYVVTNKPKRAFFFKDDLHENGFIIYYNLKEGKKFQQFRQKMISRFKDVFEMAFQRGEVPNRGFVEIKNKK